MFDFRKKVLNPVTAPLIGRIERALTRQGQTVWEKIDDLLSIKEDAHTSLLKIRKHETVTALAAVIIFVMGMGGFFVLPVAAAASTVFAIPYLGILGLGTAGFFGKKASNTTAVADEARSLESKIDTEVRTLATANPQQAIKSPRFLKGLKQRFNLSTTSDTELAQLRAALLATPPVPPAGYRLLARR